MLERPVVFLGSRLRSKSGVLLRSAGLVLWFFLVLGLLSLAGVAGAEQGILVVQVSDTSERPLEAVMIGVGGDGQMARTDSHGKARIVLAADTAVGSRVTLLLGAQDAPPDEEWVFRSPEGGTTIVPSFENDSESYVPVVLETRKERDEIAAIVERLVASRTAEVRARELELEEQNKALTEAVRALATKRDHPDPPAGIAEALEQLAAGNTDAAEAIFREVAERRTSESNEARLEAAAAWRHLGALAFLHDTEKALEAYRQAIALDPENPAGWNQLGHLLERLGKLDEAEAAYRRVLKWGISRSHELAIAVAFDALGLIYQTRGDLKEAESLQQQALSLREQLRQKEGLAITYGNLANTYLKGGDLEEAESLMRKALSLSQELDHKLGLASLYGNLAGIFLFRGDLEEAESLLRQSLALNEELGRKGGVASVYTNIGTIYRKRGELEEAESLHRKALALNEELGRKEGIANVYVHLGEIYGIRGDLEEAESLYRKALALNEEIGRKEVMASLYAKLGLIYQTRGDLEEAESLHRQALALDVELGRKEGMAIQYGNLGLIYRIRGDLEEARRLWERSRDLFREIGASPLVERVQGWIDSLGGPGGE